MHIISGIVIAALAGKMKQHKDLGGLPLLKTGPVRVAHALPGRVRFAVPGLKGSAPSELAPLQSLRKLPGITTVNASHISGSVVVKYSPGAVEPVMILMGLARVLGVSEEMEKGGTAVVLSGLKRMGEGLNRAVYEEAHGLVDLKTLLVISLITAGGIKIWRDRLGALPAGVTMLWWALNTITQGDNNKR